MESETRKTIGGYTLIREIGRGGVSVVHQAVDRRTGKTVALKVHTIPPSLSDAEREMVLIRFEREAQAMSRLSHPGIVSIHEVGEHAGQHFLALEYLEGQTLDERLALGPLTPAQALPILRQLAEAVDAVHAAGIVHRDIKPENVMLLPDGAAKLLDFGVARRQDDTAITSMGALVGSPTHIAPEQLRGNHGDPASDIWALGVLLYEMLAGHPPFEGTSVPSVLYKVAHEPPAPVSHLRASLQAVLRRALQKDPGGRYLSACALADALQDTVQASPGPVRASAAHRWGPALFLLIGAAALGFGWLRHRAASHVPPRLVAAARPAGPSPSAPSTRIHAHTPRPLSAIPPPATARRPKTLFHTAVVVKPPVPPPQFRVAQAKQAPMATSRNAAALGKARHSTPLFRIAESRPVSKVSPPLAPGPARTRHPRRRVGRTRPDRRPRSLQPHGDENWQAHRLQILEKFIWSDGR